MKLILDTETSGLPDTRGLPFGTHPDYKRPQNYNNCRLVQLCMIVVDDDFERVAATYDIIIRPRDFSITNSQFHGITDAIAAERGITIPAMSQLLADILPTVSHIYIHNASFDLNVIKSELFRAGLTATIALLDARPVICSMAKTMTLVNARNRGGYLKSPSLGELFQFLLKTPMQDAHRGVRDTENLHICLRELYRRYPTLVAVGA